MDNTHTINVRRGLLWAGITPLVVLIPSMVMGFFGSALSIYPASVPFGHILGFFAAIVTLFPWELATKILKPCDGLPPQCDTGAVVFQLTLLSFAMSFVFYACVGFVLGLLRQCVTVSTTKGNTIKYGIRHRKIVAVLCMVVCVLITLFVWGTIANIQKVS